MTERSDTADMIEPKLTNEPIEKADANDPMLPIESIDPTEPIDRIDPREPMLRIEPSDLIDNNDRDCFGMPPIMVCHCGGGGLVDGGGCGCASRAETVCLPHSAGLDAAGDAEFVQHVRHVDAGGLLADEQRLGDLTVSETVGELPEYLDLAPCQAEVSSWCRRRSLTEVDLAKKRDAGPLGELLDARAQRDRANPRGRSKRSLQAIGRFSTSDLIF
jgi:hypothetical protein